jgi:hypothetical protein
VRPFLTLRWVVAHVLVWALVVTMVLLGRWQLTVSNRKHFDLQNFGYVLQWWAFSLFVVLFWLRVMRHTRRPPAASGGGGQLVRRSGELDLVRGAPRVGPGYLAVPDDGSGAAPVVYRGYVAPNSATTPARSEGDGYHGAYNDYLWQLALADSAAERGGPARPQSEPARPADPSAPGPRTIEAGPGETAESAD